jgi:outer membrane biosynthesis protein TonB
VEDGTTFTGVFPTNRKDWLNEGSYVGRALGMERSGDSVTDIFVDPSGTPQACYVVASSGSKDLDGQSCAASMHKGKFSPARDDTGKATFGVYRYRVIWRIHDDFSAGSSLANPADITLAVARLPQGKTYLLTHLRYIVDETGRIQRCAVDQTSGFAKVDQAACETMPQRFTFAPARDAQGVAHPVVRTQSVAFEVAAVPKPQ